MVIRRTYTAGEVRELVDLFKDTPDVSPERYSGMAFVADALELFETMSEADIGAWVRRHSRSTRGT